MKVLILAGGYGTRLSEETQVIPKPMVEVGGKPILWHIMKIYSHYGFNDFIVLLGYKGYVIKEYFSHYFLHQSDVMIDLSANNMSILNNHSEPWKITLLDTGKDTMTGGRVLKAKEYIGQEPFLLTYGDGLADVNIKDLVTFHNSHKGLASMTVVQVASRFGVIKSGPDGQVTEFAEKPQNSETTINGGFFVCDNEVLNYLSDEQTVFEKEPLQKLSEEGNLFSYHHSGFWKCMDTLRDKISLNKAYETDNAEWMVWK